MFSILSLLPVIITCSALAILGRRRRLAEVRRRHFIGCLEKALTDS
jgi:hypothetical protein